MKKINILCTVIFLFFLCNKSLYSQAGSVELQDGGGGLISSHSSINDANAFVTGYVVTDLNCNEIVDLTDLLFAYNNSSDFVSIKRP